MENIAWLYWELAYILRVIAKQERRPIADIQQVDIQTYAWGAASEHTVVINPFGPGTSCGSTPDHFRWLIAKEKYSDIEIDPA